MPLEVFVKNSGQRRGYHLPPGKEGGAVGPISDPVMQARSGCMQCAIFWAALNMAAN